MLQLALGLLVIALVAGLFGFGFIASSFMAVAQILFFVFIVLAVIAFLFGGRVLRRWHG
jgi:uncharacterized membrane protein YtjA (UPF0391 family)